MSSIVKPVQKSIGESALDWKLLLVEIWQSDKTRPDEHYLKTDSDSTLFWDVPLQKHLRVDYKR